ncbi:GPR endopeptidase, partial [Symbiobacterium thermophilum]
MQARDYLSPFTDLALEATAAARGDARTELPGVVMREERYDVATVSWVEVMPGVGEQTIG